MLYYFFLIIVLSLESTIGLPVFFLYLSYKLISLRSSEFALTGLFIIALFLAVFYSLSWPVLSFSLLVFHLLSQKFSDKPFLRFCFFVLLNVFIFLMAKLQFNYFYLVDLLAFLFYFYSINFKKYAV